MESPLQAITLCISVICLLFVVASMDNFSITGHATAVPQLCNAPYIDFGVGCCLDSDNNNICDEDDVDLVDYCLDENNDGICDGHSIPMREPEVVEVHPFEFSPSSAVASRQGFSISIDNFEYELYEDWGKITKVDFSITNEAGYRISPVVEVEVHNDGQNFAPRSPYVDLDTVLDVGEFIVMPAHVEVSFTDLEENKIIELTLKDSNTWPHRPIVTVQKSFKLKKS